jgi:6-phosphofructokinase 2
MTAGMVFGLARGDSLEQAVALGVAAGGAAAMTPGTDLAGAGDIEEIYHSMTGGKE